MKITVVSLFNQTASVDRQPATLVPPGKFFAGPGHSPHMFPCLLGQRIFAHRPSALGIQTDLCPDPVLSGPVIGVFDKLHGQIGYHEQYPVTDFDLVFSNLLVDGENWTLIDYEWTFEKVVEPRELAFRAVYCYLLENEKRNRLDLDRLLRTLEITEEQAQEYREKEGKFQRYVEGKSASMAAMREIIGNKLRSPQELIRRQETQEEGSPVGNTTVR